jgi:hypothetical protein
MTEKPTKEQYDFAGLALTTSVRAQLLNAFVQQQMVCGLTVDAVADRLHMRDAEQVVRLLCGDIEMTLRDAAELAYAITNGSCVWQISLREFSDPIPF